MLIAIASCTENGCTRHNYSHKLCGWFPDEYLYGFNGFQFRELLFIFLSSEHMILFLLTCVLVLHCFSDFTQQYLHFCRSYAGNVQLNVILRQRFPRYNIPHSAEQMSTQYALHTQTQKSSELHMYVSTVDYDIIHFGSGTTHSVFHSRHH